MEEAKDNPMEEKEVESQTPTWKGVEELIPPKGFMQEDCRRQMGGARDRPNFVPPAIPKRWVTEHGNLQLMPFIVAHLRCGRFPPNIVAEALSAGINILNLSEYSWTGNLQNYLDRFYAKADLIDLNDAGYCKIFCTTLAGKAMSWFNQLPAGTISSFEHLTQRFLHYFSVNKRYPKADSYLFFVVLKEQKTLREYVQRF